MRERRGMILAMEGANGRGACCAERACAPASACAGASMRG